MLVYLFDVFVPIAVLAIYGTVSPLLLLRRAKRRVKTHIKECQPFFVGSLDSFRCERSAKSPLVPKLEVASSF